MDEKIAVGRQRALAMIDDALRVASEGTAGCVILTGPAGSGKTLLLDLAADAATRLGMDVAAGRATDVDKVAPLGTLSAALANPVKVTDTGYGQVLQLGELIEQRANNARGLLVAIDDTHWSDELTGLALRLLVPRLSTAPVLWLLTRGQPHGELPGQIAVDRLHAAGAREIRLGPLPPDAVAELCERLVGAKPDHTLLHLAARAGGNPLLVKQLFGALSEAGRIQTVDGMATALPGAMPPTFIDAVGRRLRVLSATTRQLLEAGAVCGAGFTIDDLALLLNRPPIALVPAVTEAIADGVLTDDGTGLRFSNDLVREAVCHGMPESVRAVLHREVAALRMAKAVPDQPVTNGSSNGNGNEHDGAAGTIPGTGWSSLTKAELRVVRLVTKGLTNRETARRLCLSPHTVDSHLRHAFIKLGINSRIELVLRFLAHEGREEKGQLAHIA